ncbi:MAG: serine/threonine-protein kinase [Pseudomonadota bacterium]
MTDDRFKTGGGIDALESLRAGGDDPLIGQSLGSYRVDALIAEGGMGRVYRARRADGQFDRDVAIKTLPAGMGTEYIQRFQQERRILASLSHPGIAQLFDAGLAESGGLFLVMELIDGSPIDAYAQERALDTKAKTRLMLALAEALAFAHAKLVVHRDLKPSNVFVTVDGDLKLLDFGIAKILEAPDNVTVKSRPMTPRYASPEQLLSEPISVASDIYQFGLLFLALFEQRSDAPQETQRSATERAASKRSVTVESRLAERLPAELNAIINQCLRAEPSERYASAGELASDLRNYLDGFPVSARNPGWWMKTRKFLRRNLAASVTVGALVAMGLVGNVLYLIALSKSRAEAELQAAKSTEVTEFLIGLFESNDPDQASGEALTALQILEAGASRVNEELDRQPEVRAEILRAIGRIYFRLGEWERSSDYLEEALGVQTALFGDNDPRLADTYANLAITMYSSGEFTERVLEFYEKATALHLDAYGDDLRYARLLTESALLEMFVHEDYERAVQTLEQAVEIHDRELSTDDPQRIYTFQQLMRAYERLGEFETAQAYGERAVAIAESNFGPDHARVASPLFYLSRVLESQGKYAEAAVMMRRVLASDVQVYGADDARTADTLSNIAHMLRMSGQLDEAIDYAEQSVDVLRVAVGEGHTKHAIAVSVLAVAHQEAGQYAEAEALLRETVSTLESNEGASHSFTAYGLMLYGSLMADMARYDDAIGAHSRALEIWTAVVGPGKPDSAKVELVLGQDYLWAGNLVRAEELLVSALGTHEDALPDDHLRLADNLISLGELRIAQADVTRCRAPIERGLGIREGRLPAGHADVALAQAALAACLQLNGETADARRLLDQAHAVLERSPSAAAKRVQAAYAAMPSP